MSDNKLTTLEADIAPAQSLFIDNKRIDVHGKIIKIARIKAEDEYFEDIDEPEAIIDQLRKSKLKVDIFTFWQRLPNTEPKYPYNMEWDNIAAIPIKSYDHWFAKQVTQEARNKIRKAEKKGVVVKEAVFNDELINGIISIYNETPVRQGRLFDHYGKSFEVVKKEMSDRLHLSQFIGAYYDDELIGFVKLLDTGKYVRTSGTISKIKHRDKAPMNALIAGAVRYCDKRQIPYLVYGKYVYGKKGDDSLSDFKKYNGFEKYDLPRYHIPLTILGTIALKFKLHHSIQELIPQKILTSLVRVRKLWYEKKYKK